MINSRFLREPLSAYGSLTEIDSARVGEISDDRSAVVGRNNWCFIYEGSNNYRGAYHENSHTPLGDQWARLIERRQRACEALGARFIQLIVPNKATLMPEYFPEPLGVGVTKALQRLLEATPDANFLCPLEMLRNAEVRDHVFRRNDSHLTLSGNAMLVELLLNAAGIDLGEVPWIEFTEVLHNGDLGGKFQDPIPETVRAPLFHIGLLDTSRLTNTLAVQAEGFSGTRQSFHNPSAPLKMTAMVFGNSFFERVPSWGMSPILSAIFEKYHFIWGSDFDEVCALSSSPDIIICQTCERFMNRLPLS